MDCKDDQILRKSGEIIHGLCMYAVWSKPRVFLKHITKQAPLDYYEMQNNLHDFKKLKSNIFPLVSFGNLHICYCTRSLCGAISFNMMVVVSVFSHSDLFLVCLLCSQAIRVEMCWPEQPIKSIYHAFHTFIFFQNFMKVRWFKLFPNHLHLLKDCQIEFVFNILIRQHC